MGLAHSISEKVFQQIHGNNLVYNTCWEDPRCDRKMMNLDEHSRVVMLTSAGCNALDYLLDNPKSIDCVDLNARQNALLHLKMALIQERSHGDLYEFFGKGSTRHTRDIYTEQVAAALPEAYSREYWQRNLRYFNGKGLRQSFYWLGSSGTVAWMIRKWMQSQPDVLRLTRKMFDASTLSEQQAWYEQLEPLLLNRFVRWFVRQHLVQSMLGVPKSQQALAGARYEDGMAGYVRDCFRHVFMKLPLTDNYFWKLYFDGHYTPDCCPNYLKAEHFDTLRDRTPRLRTHTTSLSGFLQENPGKYTHFVLLDHQDWLAAHLKPALEEEWHLIFENAAPGAKVLLRSAAFELDFLPDFVYSRIRFDAAAAADSYANDRVGTYASTWFGEIV